MLRFWTWGDLACCFMNVFVSSTLGLLGWGWVGWLSTLVAPTFAYRHRSGLGLV